MKKQPFSLTSKLFQIQIISTLKSLHSQNDFLLCCYGLNNLTERGISLLRILNKDLKSMEFPFMFGSLG